MDAWMNCIIQHTIHWGNRCSKLQQCSIHDKFRYFDNVFLHLKLRKYFCALFSWHTVTTLQSLKKISYLFLSAQVVCFMQSRAFLSERVCSKIFCINPQNGTSLAIKLKQHVPHRLYIWKSKQNLLTHYEAVPPYTLVYVRGVFYMWTKAIFIFQLCQSACSYLCQR